MPFRATVFDYGLFIISLIVFYYSFFIYPNIQIYISSLICVYEAFQIFVLPGKPRLREIDKKLLLFKFKTAIKNKLHEEMEEYHRWRLRK